MTNKIYTIDEIKQIVNPIAQKYGIKRIYLFGSYARGNATPNSDIDLRIDGEIKTLIQLGGLNIDLEEAFDKEVDAIPTENLDIEIMFNICDEEVVLYG